MPRACCQWSPYLAKAEWNQQKEACIRIAREAIETKEKEEYEDFKKEYDQLKEEKQKLQQDLKKT